MRVIGENENGQITSPHMCPENRGSHNAAAFIKQEQCPGIYCDCPRGTRFDSAHRTSWWFSNAVDTRPRSAWVSRLHDSNITSNASSLIGHR